MRSSMKLLFIFLLGAVLVVGCNSKESSTPYENSQINESKSTLDHFNTVIGEVVQGEFQFDDDINDYISNWEDLINNGSSLNLSFDNVNIEVEDGIYYLVGVDDSEEATSRVQLVLSSGNFYERSYPGPVDEEPQGTTCTCSGCKTTGPLSANDCIPKQNAIGWYCTSCPRGFGECVKTVVVNTGSNGGVLD